MQEKLDELLKKWNEGSISNEEVKEVIKILLGEKYSNIECLNDPNFINTIKLYIDKQRSVFRDGKSVPKELKTNNKCLYSEDEYGELFYFIPHPAQEEQLKKEVFRFNNPLPLCIINRDNQQIQLSYDNKDITVLISNKEDGLITYARREVLDEYGNVKEISLFDSKEEDSNDYSEITSKIIEESPDRIEQTCIRSKKNQTDPDNITRIITNKSINKKVESLTYSDLLTALKIEDAEECLEQGKYYEKDGVIINPEYTNDEDLLQAVLEIENEEVKAKYLDKIKNRKKEEYTNQHTK